MTDPTRFEKLTLEVRSVDRQVRLRLVGARTEGEVLIAEAQHTFEVGEVLGITDHIAHKIRVTNVEGVDRIIEDRLDLLGQQLFDLLFPDEIAWNLRHLKSEFLVFDLEESLLQIPWELGHDGSDFLCCRFSTGRVVPSWTPQRTTSQGGNRHNLSFLFLSNPTGDLPAASEEAEYLFQVVKSIPDSSVEWLNFQIDRGTAREWLTEVDAVHYSGHTEGSKEGRNGPCWILSDGPLDQPLFEQVRKTGRNLPFLVFSNSCLSGETAARDDEGGLGGSLAQSFISLGCLHYIGSVTEVADVGGRDFARAFYQHALHGGPVGKALRHARLESRFNRLVDDLTWAQYILYGDPSTGIYGQTTTLPEVKSLLFADAVFPSGKEAPVLFQELLPAFPDAAEIRTSDDRLFATFERPSEAVRFALLLHSKARESVDNATASVGFRVGIGLGEVFVEKGVASDSPRHVGGFPVEVTQRVQGIASVRQTLATRPVFDNARAIIRGNEIPGISQVAWHNHGPYRMKGLEEPLEVCEVGEEGLSPLSPRPPIRWKHIVTFLPTRNRFSGGDPL